MKKFGELFAGAGGMAYGLREAGLSPTWAVDYDHWACETYNSMIGGNAIESKVEEVDFKSLGAVDGLAFGFPCNDFSMVGERKGTSGYFGGLYKFAEKAIGIVRPKWFVAENVPGMLASGGREIMTEFANAGDGYNLSVHLYRFEEYGVPQRRWRVIGVGIRKDLALTFMPPAPTHKKPVTARAALVGVSKVKDNNELARHTEKVIQLLNSIPPGSNCWDPAVPEHLRLDVANVRLSLIYRRLHPGEPSYTIVGSGGGGTYGYHWDKPRALTNRERARLQSFPDSFVFKGPKDAVRRQIGMAVPPLGAKAIGMALMRTLCGKAYESVEPSIGVFEATRKSTRGSKQPRLELHT